MIEVEVENTEPRVELVIEIEGEAIFGTLRLGFREMLSEAILVLGH